jgi:signal transduction histidine kinase
MIRDGNSTNLDLTGQRLRISVIDSGIGIKHEDFSKLFKVFGKITQTDEANP